MENNFRRLAFFTINVNVAKKHQLKKYSDVWPIPILDDQGKEETEEEQIANFNDFQKTLKIFKHKK